MNRSMLAIEYPTRARVLVRELGEVARAAPWFVTAPLYRRWHLRWGATEDEVGAAMPGDHLLPVSQFTATRAITIDAPPEAVWPWLLQVGFRRAGFYSYDLLDSLSVPSAYRVLPQWQEVQVGDVAAPMTSRATPQTSFVVAAVRPPEHLVWAKPDSTWAWRLTPLTGEHTRLVTRLKQRYRLNPSALMTVPLIEFADFPMMRKMLRGVKQRAEAYARAQGLDNRTASDTSAGCHRIRRFDQIPGALVECRCGGFLRSETHDDSTRPD
jgi:hypothetical protein